ncbi:conserved hypothetical protein [Gammaproteobacteria bacterium]
MSSLLDFWLGLLSGKTNLKAEFTAAEWNQLYALAERHQLTALFYWRLQNSTPPIFCAAEVFSRLRLAYLEAANKNLKRERELGAALQALQSKGLAPVLFKGAALAFTLYPSPACRSMGDLDLWLTGEEMSRAQIVLEQLGYFQRADEVRPVAWQIQREGEIQLYGTKPEQEMIELHWGVFAGEWFYRTTNIDRDGIRARFMLVPIAKQSALIMEPIDALIQVAAHIAIGNKMSGATVRSLMDVALLAHQVSDWDRLIERAQSWRLATLVGVVLEATDELFGLTEAQTAIACLRPKWIRRTLLRHFINRDTILAGQHWENRRRQWLILLALIDRPRDMSAILFRTFWPEPVWLEMCYEQSNLQVRLKHLLSAMTGKVKST